MAKASRSKPKTETQDAAKPKITKSEAVRRALAAGKDQPSEGVSYIKGEFGIDIDPGHFSAVKSTHLKKLAGGGVKAKAAKKPMQTARAGGSSSVGEADLLRVMEALKPLVERMGSDKIKRIVDLLD